MVKNVSCFREKWQVQSQVPLKKVCACLLAKDTESVPVTISIRKLYSNKLMLPLGLLFHRAWCGESDAAEEAA